MLLIMTCNLKILMTLTLKKKNSIRRNLL